MESTKHDGHFDQSHTFKDGLNIPAGVAMGNGGVYVTNSPDILFPARLNRPGKADQQTTILTGFGRDDRHELPNSLTWGPDGWLYGMNGVFNQARRLARWQDSRLHLRHLAVASARRTKFELFAQGTSNPWGLDYNRQGDWFVSCCVIDHLFHMTQSGYYPRQGGPYPPQTHWLPSITTQRHQMAAYAGLCIYDADAIPRGISRHAVHGQPARQRHQSRHAHAQRLDVHAAQCARFSGRPTTSGSCRSREKIGPDGCLYFMDWYDRYHCYQDAGAIRQGVDRSRGRIYRISYGDPPPYRRLICRR